MSRDKIEKWDEVNGITAPERNLEAFLEIIAGTAVGKRGLGIQGLPFGQNVVFVLLDDNIIL